MRNFIYFILFVLYTFSNLLSNEYLPGESPMQIVTDSQGNFRVLCWSTSLDQMFVKVYNLNGEFIKDSVPPHDSVSYTPVFGTFIIDTCTPNARAYYRDSTTYYIVQSKGKYSFQKYPYFIKERVDKHRDTINIMWDRDSIEIKSMLIDNSNLIFVSNKNYSKQEEVGFVNLGSKQAVTYLPLDSGENCESWYIHRYGNLYFFLMTVPYENKQINNNLFLALCNFHNKTITKIPLNRSFQYQRFGYFRGKIMLAWSEAQTICDSSGYKHETIIKTDVIDISSYVQNVERRCIKDLSLWDKFLQNISSLWHSFLSLFSKK